MRCGVASGTFCAGVGGRCPDDAGRPRMSVDVFRSTVIPVERSGPANPPPAFLVRGAGGSNPRGGGPRAPDGPGTRTLLPPSIAARIPPLYSQEEQGDKAIAVVKFFAPWTTSTWYARASTTPRSVSASESSAATSASLATSRSAGLQEIPLSVRLPLILLRRSG